MNSELTLHVNVYQSFKTHQLELLRRLVTSDNVITYRSLTGTKINLAENLRFRGQLLFSFGLSKAALYLTNN